VQKREQRGHTEFICLTIDLVQSFDRGKVSFTVDCHRPGRQGHFSRDWSNVNGSQLSADQVEDLANWVGKTVTNAIVAIHGVQEVFDS
jgi:hypothetical protein